MGLSETVYVTVGNNPKTIHYDPDCLYLARSERVAEKDAGMIPNGYFPVCHLCEENHE